jgi:aldehyde:ferredoxin oxidoreductase
MLTNIRGGDHLRCRSTVENLRYNENKFDYLKERYGFDQRMYDNLDMPENLKKQAIDLETDTVDIAIMSKWSEDLINLFNSVGVCIRPPVMNNIGPAIVADAITAVTGLKITAEELMLSAERSWNLMKLFNIREGEKPEDSKFPHRFYTETINGKILNEIKIQQVLEHYYQARGWNETGQPTDDKLKELGIV